jgi:hypothetical protein
VTVTLPPLAALPNLRRRWVMLMLALFFGLVSLAAVVTPIPSIEEAKFECHPQVLTADDGVTSLTADDGQTLLSTGLQECQAEPADHWIPLPAWARGIWRWVDR